MDTLEGASDDDGVVFRDVIMLALAGFVAIVVLILPHVNPKGVKAAATADPPGNVIVELRWPDGIDSDMDLWVQAPGDMPVGYSNKGGAVFNLLRDDLGQRLDATGINYEVSYSRGIVPGEYTVNAHLYRNPSRQFPIPLTVVASVKETASTSARQILARKFDIGRTGEEATAFRFRLDAEGRLVQGSVSKVFKPLRAGRKS